MADTAIAEAKLSYSIGRCVITIAIVVCVLLLLGSERASAQWLRYVPVDVATPDPIGRIAVPGVLCRYEDGSPASDSVFWDGEGYIVPGLLVQPQAIASLRGACQTWIGGQYYPPPEYRYIDNVKATHTEPVTGASGYGFSRNLTYSQTLDSTNSSTSTAFGYFSAVNPGNHLFDFVTHSFQTNCLIQPEWSALVRHNVIAVACLPKWNVDALNQVVPRGRFPTDGTPIVVRYPDRTPFSTAVPAAVNGWSAALSAAGLPTLTLNPVAGGSCMNDDSHCIQVGYQSDVNLTCGALGCGCDRASSIEDGQYSGSSKIALRAEWNEAFAQWVISVELGHLFGLGERGNDSCVDSVMNTAACNSDPGSNAITARPSDAQAVANTPYGNNLRVKTCGWVQ